MNARTAYMLARTMGPVLVYGALILVKFAIEAYTGQPLTMSSFPFGTV